MKDLGNVFILGDSYSTFEGFVPAGFDCWYSPQPQEQTDVTAVAQTWWHQLLANTRSQLLLNSSWSGSTLCHTGYDAADWSREMSFCARMRNLTEAGFFACNKVDTFLLFGGTNDSWAGSPLGRIQYGPKTEEDLFSVFPAFCWLVETVRQNCPQARLVCVVNTELTKEIKACIDTVCAHYAVQVIRLEAIHLENGHPGIEGMHQIYTQILENL